MAKVSHKEGGHDPMAVDERVREDKEEEESDDDDEEEGWITPENLKEVYEEMGGVVDEMPQSLATGCITTDFAMQVRREHIGSQYSTQNMRHAIFVFW